MLSRPIPGEIYKHFKGKLYRIVTLAQHSETGEELVIYQALYGEYQVYARPLSMFLEAVDEERYPNISQKMRFEKVSELVTPILKDTDQERKMIEGDNGQRAEVHAGKTEDNGQGAEVHAGKTGDNGQGAEVHAGKTEDNGQGAEVHAGKTEDNIQNIEAYEGISAQTQMSENQTTDVSYEEQAEELQLDPLVLEFLDAGSYEERIRILTALHHRITNEMITTMALVLDLEIGDGDVEERYGELKNCLFTFERYEGSRLR